MSQVGKRSHQRRSLMAMAAYQVNETMNESKQIIAQNVTEDVSHLKGSKVHIEITSREHNCTTNNEFIKLFLYAIPIGLPAFMIALFATVLLISYYRSRKQKYMLTPKLTVDEIRALNRFEPVSPGSLFIGISPVSSTSASNTSIWNCAEGELHPLRNLSDESNLSCSMVRSTSSDEDNDETTHSLDRCSNLPNGFVFSFLDTVTGRIISAPIETPILDVANAQIQVPIHMKKIFNESEEVVVAKKELRVFILDCLEAVGCDAIHGEQLADILIYSDYRGHYSHGINRLHVYVNDIATGASIVEGQPKILKRKGATAWIDGRNLLGPVVGNFCMKLAIELAKEVGIGWVVAKNSSHFGIAGWYAMQAMKYEMIGMAFTNTSPCVFPTRSAEKSIGSNPICMVAPAKDGDSFFLDMASTTVAYGKIEVAAQRGVHHIPRSWGCDATGHETTDPQTVLSSGGLQPLGGQEETGGYKGSGLSMMVEVFCGILGDASFGKHIRRWQTTETTANLGQCFVVVDPNCFAPGFSDRLQQFIDETRDLKPLVEDQPVLVAGDPERSHMAMCDEVGGIVYKKAQLLHIHDLASRLRIPHLTTKELAEKV
ncbi:Malate dehydrogenase [Toxocara canis]|uniref:Malate dehydrogenase n=1 Tax=Toxocara canis TaxID=6265 RepID=A0A0B2V5S8_TOXCA|nr:Malate dehydrogenase [Toxocara canis]